MDNFADIVNGIRKVFDSLIEREKTAFLRITGVDDIDEFDAVDLSQLTHQEIRVLEAKALLRLIQLRLTDEPPDDVA